MCCWVVCIHAAFAYIFICDSKIVVLKYLTHHGSVRNLCQMWLKKETLCLVILGYILRTETKLARAQHN